MTKKISTEVEVFLNKNQSACITLKVAAGARLLLSKESPPLRFHFWQCYIPIFQPMPIKFCLSVMFENFICFFVVSFVDCNVSERYWTIFQRQVVKSATQRGNIIVLLLFNCACYYFHLPLIQSEHEIFFLQRFFQCFIVR